MGLEDSLKNVLAAGGALHMPPRNTPAQYADRQRQYYEPETAAFISQYAQYSTNFFQAMVQGIDPTDFYMYVPQMIRLAEVSSASLSSSRQRQDVKLALFADAATDYVARGAKILTAGCTWLVTGWGNMAGVPAQATIERCDATWNHWDYYGNLVKEPLVVTTMVARSAALDEQDLVPLPQAHYTVKAQYNPDTATLRENSRIILGNSAYALRGISDFLQEFTGDDASVHLCEFYAYYEEPNLEIDDMENHVAGGKTFSWTIQVSGAAQVAVGGMAALSAKSERCGEVVESTTEHPVDYLWSSGNPAVAEVDDTGTVTGIAPGACDITCALVQNPAVTSTWRIIVAEAAALDAAFLQEPPASLAAYETCILEAARFVGGQQTAASAAWQFSGADPAAYSAQVDGNRVTLQCWGPSETPLTVTADFGDVSAAAMIRLLGA